MFERFGGTRNDSRLTHIEVINGTEGSPAWLPGHPPRTIVSPPAPEPKYTDEEKLEEKAE